LAQSSVTIVYLGVFFICVLINYIVNSIKNKKFLPLIIVLGVLIICLPILYFVIITFMTGRFPHLIKLAVTNPLALLKDESIIARVNAIIFAVESFFKNFGIPHGFVYEGMPGIRIMSGYGTLLYEMGVFGVILIVSVFRYLFRTFNMAYAITITIVMFSAVQLGLPIFAFLIGFSMYEANAISHNKKITEKSRWYVKRYSYRSEKVKILNDCEP